MIIVHFISFYIFKTVVARIAVLDCTSAFSLYV